MAEYAQVKLDEEVGVKGDEDLPVAATVLSIDDAEEGKATQTPTLVRVVAPCGLPPRYRLTVKTAGDDMFDVIVPDPGVHEGQEFEAEKISLEPIVGRWSDGICDCGSSDGAVQCTSLFCAGFVYGALMERLKLDWLARPGPYKKTYVIVSTVFVMCLVTYLMRLSGIMSILLIYLIAIQTKTRMAVREKYQIPGDCLTDCCSVYWCNCCAALQMHRHMKRSGDSARPFFKTVGKAEII